MPIDGHPGKIQMVIRNKNEMSQFWHWGDIYQDMPPAMDAVLKTGERQTVSNRAGWVSALAPVYNSLGDRVGVIEAVSRVEYRRPRKREMTPWAAAFLIKFINGEEQCLYVRCGPQRARDRRSRVVCALGHAIVVSVGITTVLLAAGALFGATPEPVKFTHGTRVWPTYTYSREETDAPLFKVVENGGFYPYTAFDWESRSEKPSPVTYDSLVLENEYLRVEFLPELGGRIWSAYDKVTKRELFYHPTVIKPGRYNARNDWPVGNLELYGPYDSHMITWPGEPWPWAMVRHPDGSATVILTHIDHFFRDKISLEVTLHPGKAYVETTIHLFNKNLLPNRYLIWTNAGVKAAEGSRFIYPMTKTIGHVSSAIRPWPIIDGVDLSWNKNNKNMLGVFGLDIDDNFMSIYDYTHDFGTVCYHQSFAGARREDVDVRFGPHRLSPG